ncbi:MAG: hypothetical protein ACFFKA_00070 [Candidatus Thorarchaeota archaeon]
MKRTPSFKHQKGQIAEFLDNHTNRGKKVWEMVNTRSEIIRFTNIIRLLGYKEVLDMNPELDNAGVKKIIDYLIHDGYYEDAKLVLNLLIKFRDEL